MMDISLEGATVLRTYKRAAGFKPIKELSEAIREEELLDIMVLLYHLGLAQNFKQVCQNKSGKTHVRFLFHL
jgi:Kip1 ubiquitination-promoting complex protein 1